MKINPADFQAKQGEAFDLHQRPTDISPLYTSKAHYKKKLKKQIDKMSDLQRKLYASNEHSVLIIFQAMDAAGKDSSIRHVMSGINPQGCQVHSFKHPTETELDHDFLWRANQVLPERGRIGIFNRSYYEEVLIARVHPEILDSQRIPDEALHKEHIWRERFRSINDLEQHLTRNGTRVIKFFLHLSKEEQCQRFLARIDNPDKNWKFSDADIQERAFWPQYMQAYEDCISSTTSDEAPWYVIPADDKRNARLIIAKTIVETFESLDMLYPEVDEQRKLELQRLRTLLVDQSK
ncbi:MAG: phosphate--nucleotide phosphotransferase [Alteromonadaceae bacterium]|uniref:ADP-polyphosphate phosphotransferase n=1 Tax=Paraglaciecola chathamensis TaxID=368405 RepID=UPI000C35A2B4|nr:ADP-polyphosphate phosphotransferase [Paraglaciecola agarilytica]MBN23572.1 phosphate--nucleotide phosphotransferase [Alteromonadaceae bacterium]|tara:strand:+ start:11154 stop:12032 length:879 start_codon:yes stop_codon:yes gene_type:complete